MKYVSTRGNAPELGFKDTLMAGLAHDGGLYIPQNWPSFSPGALRALQGKSYTTIAKTIIWPFVEGEIEREKFDPMIEAAYKGFHHPAICPLVQTGANEFILELTHGPTLAFKDIAMQLLAQLMDHILAERATRATIIGATSGDTGGAAIQAFAGRDNCDLFILFPKGRVSPFQQRQMTTNPANNVFALAIDGDFDDCQALVKTLFNDHAFRAQFCLSGVNSINWARIMAQIVYYFTAALALGSPDRSVSFSVPTGNFGDIFAGYVASRMGLPISRLIIASNENDILVRLLETGSYTRGQLVATTSPSMDIQVSSNFERLLYEISGRDATRVCEAFSAFEKQGCFHLDEAQFSALGALFSAGRSTMEETAATIAKLYHETGYLADPHTAIALKVAHDHPQHHVPMVVLSTAHPAKFADAVTQAVGGDHAPYPAPPSWYEQDATGQQHVAYLANDSEVIKDFISSHSRLNFSAKKRV